MLCLTYSIYMIYINIYIFIYIESSFQSMLNILVVDEFFSNLLLPHQSFTSTALPVTTEVILGD